MRMNVSCKMDTSRRYKIKNILLFTQHLFRGEFMSSCEINGYKELSHED